MKCSVVGNLLLVALVLGSTVLLAGGKAAEEKPLKVHANANRIPAGQMRDGILTLALRAGVGQWRPEGPDGPAITIEALGEVTGPLQVPAPLIRVPEGTVIRATVRNDLSATLRVHGFCARDGTPCPPLEVPASAVRDVHFMAARAGTYHYWATSSAASGC